MLRLLLLATPLAFSLVYVSPTLAQERKLAVVIGVNAYRSNSGLPRLQHATADAKALSSTLREVGFTVYEMTHDVARQPGQEEMAPQLPYIRDQIKGVLDFPNLGAKDSVLITLHGHGVQYDLIENGKKTPKFYFCPADATVSGLKTANDITDRNRLLPLDELYADLEACKAATKLLIVDACRNDPTSPSVFRESLASSTLPKLPPPTGGTAAFFSCKANQRAVEDAALKQGVFSHFLVKGLQGEADLSFGGRPADGVITFSELSTYVANSTYAHVFNKFKVRQSPELRGDYDLNLPLARMLTGVEAVEQIFDMSFVEVARHTAEEFGETRLIGPLMVAKSKVTNADFGRFVDESGYVTVKEYAKSGDTKALRKLGYLTGKDDQGIERLGEGRTWRDHPPDATLADIHDSDLNSFRDWISQRTRSKVRFLDDYEAMSLRKPRTIVDGQTRSQTVLIVEDELNANATNPNTYCITFKNGAGACYGPRTLLPSDGIRLVVEK